MSSMTVALTVSNTEGSDAAALLLRRIERFARQTCVSRIILVHAGARPDIAVAGEVATKLHFIQSATWFSGATLSNILEAADTDTVLIVLTGAEVEIGSSGLERFREICECSGAGLVYSDYEELAGGEAVERRLIDYQPGSLRDWFNFGGMVLISKRAAELALNKYGRLEPQQRWGGAYDLRLKLSADHPIVHIPETLYTVRAGAPHVTTFALLLRGTPPAGNGPVNRDYQLEMESSLTAHLRRVGAFIEPDNFTPPPPPPAGFPTTASVVIPVRNREKTIAAAVESALGQHTTFDYNVIVVDHHSTDGTTDILRRLSSRHKQIVHLFPTRANISIGGLWNTAVYSPACGLHAVQLDSDDVYAGPHALERMVAGFYEPGGARESAGTADAPPLHGMVIGSYVLVDYDLNKLPHGAADYREWPRDNGRNDVLRLDGLGAPRAYYVPVLRRFGFPDVSYGEDYAVCLRISREYSLGRIFEPLYYARQWEDNSERTLPLSSTNRLRLNDLLFEGTTDQTALLDRVSPALSKLLLNTRNRYEAYKDWLRTVELQARITRCRQLNTQPRAFPK
jgi:glycosyltransferase involved in cell wall biosynthesis